MARDDNEHKNTPEENPPGALFGDDEGFIDDEDWLPQLTAEGVDPELEQLSPNINWFRPVLMLAVIGFAIYLGTQFTVEMNYFFSDRNPIDIGDVTEFPDRMSNPDTRPQIPHNRFVRVNGIPSRLSISCAPAVRYFKLVGAHVYVELPMGKDLSTIACKAEREKSMPIVDNMEFFEGTGRAVAFTGTGKRYGNLKGFYERNYGELFCSSMTESKREERIKMLRQVLREKHKLDKGEYPSDEELEKMVAAETLCFDAYLIQADTSPNDYWPYLLVYLVLGLIIMWNLFTIYRFIRKLTR